MHSSLRGHPLGGTSEYHERLHPDSSPLGLFSSHSERYRFAATMAKGKVVLDVACGSGYGSAILADEDASLVISGDNSDVALKLTKRGFLRPALRLVRVDVANLPIRSGTVDLVVSMETVEHVGDVDACFREFGRVLKGSGIAVISTPNKAIVSPDSHSSGNPYHLREFTIREFASKLDATFSNVTIYGQSFVSARPFLDALRRAAATIHYPWIHWFHENLREKLPMSRELIGNRRFLQFASCPARLRVVNQDSDNVPAYLTAVCRK